MGCVPCKHHYTESDRSGPGLQDPNKEDTQPRSRRKAPLSAQGTASTAGNNSKHECNANNNTLLVEESTVRASSLGALAVLVQDSFGDAQVSDKRLVAVSATDNLEKLLGIESLHDYTRYWFSHTNCPSHL